MDFCEAIAAKIAEYDADAADGGVPGFDAWDRAARDYLEDVRKRLLAGEDAASVYARLKDELPRLEELVEAEEACYTFDWYDDHHYIKIYSGQVQACRAALALYEACEG